jgi:hypothetical protein
MAGYIILHLPSSLLFSSLLFSLTVDKLPPSDSGLVYCQHPNRISLPVANTKRRRTQQAFIYVV